MLEALGPDKSQCVCVSVCVCLRVCVDMCDYVCMNFCVPISQNPPCGGQVWRRADRVCPFLLLSIRQGWVDGSRQVGQAPAGVLTPD